ncbi:uncharacterized protein LOC114801034 [Denticeps clupeoides]|uniref:uncharacterized protein LOC114801034 n=1 Tax=Denticeps clupeoides TaxID=299321 RepID=UPI0010A4DA16|nr:uncharacterized protein LOC114801034 [Denticeps clupeoides]
MSTGGNVRTVSPAGSGIPLPNNMAAFSKLESRHLSSNLPVHRASSFSASTSSIPSIPSIPTSPLAREFGIKGALKRRGVLGPQFSPTRVTFSPERSSGTRSAYSSPQVPKKLLSYSKDTLDLHNRPQPEPWRDLGRNGNWKSGHPNSKSLDNTDVQAPSHNHHRPSNGNLLWHGPAANRRLRAATEQDQWSTGGELSSIKTKNQAGRAGREVPRMAAVAPFRFSRCVLLQVADPGGRGRLFAGGRQRLLL